MANKAGSRYGFPLLSVDLLANTAPITGPMIKPNEYAMPTRAYWKRHWNNSDHLQITNS